MTLYAVASATTGKSITKNITFLLIVTVAVLANVFKVECRTLQENQYQPQIRLRRNELMNFDEENYMNDGPSEDEDEEPETNDDIKPSILTTGLVVETTEGTTVNLPCRVPSGILDEIGLIWINGSKTIMTDSFPSELNSRVKPGEQSTQPTEYDEHTLTIEQVTRWDSGTYKCRITSVPFVEISHTLRVTHPPKILSVQAMGAESSMNGNSANKYTVKQGEPVQLMCTVAGFPEPTVQWIKKAKYQQPQIQQVTTQSPGQDQSAVLTPQISTTTVVSETNEVRIESVVAHRDAGNYECVAHNSGTHNVVSKGASAASASNMARMSLELDVEYIPDVTVPQSIVSTGETYQAVMTCSVLAFPKPKVSWEKELITASGSSWQPLFVDGSNSRYIASRQFTPSHNSSSVGPNFSLKVKQVQGPQDFGRYRCMAENKYGISYSDPITLTGSPARPQAKSVQVSTIGKSPELSWNVDSWSPVVEYQLQYKRQEDSSTSWADVRPQPPVTESFSGANAGDERRYVVNYEFGGEAHQQQLETAIVPLSLKHGITYVARLRSRNTHGWSEWSDDVVFSGGMDRGTDGENDINQHDGHQHNGKNVIKASAGSNNAPSGPKQSCGVALFFAATVALAVTATSVC